MALMRPAIVLVIALGAAPAAAGPRGMFLHEGAPPPSGTAPAGATTTPFSWTPPPMAQTTPPASATLEPGRLSRPGGRRHVPHGVHPHHRHGTPLLLYGDGVYESGIYDSGIYDKGGYGDEQEGQAAVAPAPAPAPPAQAKPAAPPPPDPRGPLMLRARGVPAKTPYTVGEALPPDVPQVTLDWRQYGLPRPPDGLIYARVRGDVLLIDPVTRVVERRVDLAKLRAAGKTPDAG